MTEVSATSKLTDWKKEPSLGELQADLTMAKPAHDEHTNQVNTWLDNYYVKGKAVQKNKRGSNIVPKLIRKSAEWRAPALSEPFLSSYDLFQVNPMSWADRKAAEQNAMILNYQFQTKINKVAFIDEYVRTCVEQGSAIVRVGWDYEEKEVLTDIPEYGYMPDPNFAQVLEQFLPKYQENPAVFKNTQPQELVASIEASLQAQQPIRAQVTGIKQEKVVKAIRNQPTLEVCDYRNFYVDPTCNGNIDKAQFVIHSFETSLAELKRDERYKNIDQINTENGQSAYDPDHNYGEHSEGVQFNDEARKKIIVFEYWGYWDTDDSGIVRPIVASWVGNTLIRLEDNPFPDGKPPFVIANYIPQRGEVFGIPDGELLEDNQKILGATFRGMIDLLGKSANSQTAMQKNFLDPTNRRRYENGEDYDFNPGMDPRTAIHMHTFPEIPQSAMMMVQNMNMEAEALTGVKSFSGSQGISGAALGETNLGIRSALDATSKREMSILRRIADGIIQIGRKIVAMNAEFLDEKEIIRITDEEFVEIKRDDLAGFFDIKLSISTAENDEAQAQQIAMMMQTIGNNMDEGLRSKMLAKIFRLRKMPDFAKELEEYRPEPDPMQQQLAQLEMQKLQAEIALLQAQAGEAQTKGNLNQVKQGTEKARAASMQGDADQKALDYVEQQDGVKHSRDMEKQDGQMSGQLALQQLRDQNQQDQARFNHNSELLRKKAEWDNAPSVGQ